MNEWDKERYKDIWIEGDDNWSLMALINGEWGWLMYLNEDTQDCFISRNPDYTGPEDATMEFYLSNGQLDYYPLSYVIPIEQVTKALEYFEEQHKLPEFITWHNDNEHS